MTIKYWLWKHEDTDSAPSNHQARKWLSTIPVLGSNRDVSGAQSKVSVVNQWSPDSGKTLSKKIRFRAIAETTWHQPVTSTCVQARVHKHPQIHLYTINTERQYCEAIILSSWFAIVPSFCCCFYEFSITLVMKCSLRLSSHYNATNHPSRWIWCR